MTGLRGRLTLAVAAVSALTLVLAGALLLVPLDRKLREDLVTSLSQAARIARPAVRRQLLKSDAGSLRAAAETARRQARAEPTFVDASGRVLAGEPPIAGTGRLAARALADGRLRSRTARGEAQVAVPIRAGERPVALVLERPLAALDSAMDVVQRSLIAAVLVAVTIAAMIGAALATRLVRRLARLRSVALAITETGALPHVPEDSSRDEIGDLGRAMATMTRRLDRQEQARRTFVSTASHELRTPLSSLTLMLDDASELLGEAPPDTVEARAQVQRAAGQTQRLAKLAAELLDLSRIDAGLELRREPLDLAALTRAVAGEFASHATTIDTSAVRPAWVLADPGSVSRIIRILLDNALKFSPDDALIVVETMPAAGTATLTVRDDGPGVPEAERERIFGRFERGAGDQGAGFGLGLAIGRELARRMEGDLVLEQDGPGATFVLALPATDQHDPNTLPT